MIAWYVCPSNLCLCCLSCTRVKGILKAPKLKSVAFNFIRNIYILSQKIKA